MVDFHGREEPQSQRGGSGCADDDSTARVPSSSGSSDSVSGLPSLESKNKSFWLRHLDGTVKCEPVSISVPSVIAHKHPSKTSQFYWTASAWPDSATIPILKAAWAATLRKFTRQDPVVFGYAYENAKLGYSASSGHPSLFAPCSVLFDDKAPVTLWLERLETEHTSAELQAAAAPLTEDVDREIRRQLELNGMIFSTALDLHSASPDESVCATRFTTQCDLLVVLSSAFGEGPPAFRIIHNPITIPAADCTRILDQFQATIAQIQSSLENNGAVAGLWTLSDSETADLRRYCHGPRVPLPFRLLHHGFERHVPTNPTRVALEYEDKKVTYAELDLQANRLAAQMLDAGVQPGNAVALVMPRSLEFGIAMVAVLKCGGVLVPCDPLFPLLRIEKMARDSRCCIVLATENLPSHQLGLSSESESAFTFIRVDSTVLGEPRSPSAEESARFQAMSAATSAAVADTDPYAILYTSGSTGEPKGVPLPHRGAVNVVTGDRISPNCRMAQFSAQAFDSCQSETWGSLCNAATLVFRTDNAFDTIKKVDSVICTPTFLAQLGDPRDYPLLRNIYTGGEGCSLELKKLWSPVVTLRHAYGPSETTIITHSAIMSDADAVAHLGKPMKNVSCYVLDNAMRPVPAGVVGEIYLGGLGVSPGYLRQPDLTATCFFPDPYWSSAPDAASVSVESPRMFKTGDLGRLTANGDLLILGRCENQMTKIKGYRVQLDAIEAEIRTHPGVHLAAVILKDATHLAAFYTTHPGHTVTAADLRALLSLVLPAYSIPGTFQALDEMPTNTNDKIDKRALKAIPIEMPVDSLVTIGEQLMASVWSNVLGIPAANIGRQSSFIALGGDSISAIRITMEARKVGLAIAISDVMRLHTLAEMADCAVALEDGQNDEFAYRMAKAAESYFETSFARAVPMPAFTFLKPHVESLRPDTTVECELPVKACNLLKADGGSMFEVAVQVAVAGMLRKFVRVDDISFVVVPQGTNVLLPRRFRLDKTVSLAEFVKSQQDIEQRIQEYERALDAGHLDSSFNPNLFASVVLSFHNTRTETDAVALLGRLEKEPDLHIRISTGPAEALFAEFVYASDASTATQIGFMADELCFTLSQIVDTLAGAPFIMDDLWQLSKNHTTLLTSLCVGPALGIPYQLLHHGFELQARDHPDWSAVEFGSAALTYRDLDVKSSLLALTIQRVASVRSGHCVAVLAQRSLEFVVALLALSKCGATAVPIDSKFPVAHILHVLADAEASAVVVADADGCALSDELALAIPAVLPRVSVVLDSLAESGGKAVRAVTPRGDPVRSSDPALIVYTSGSTGKPKGVPVSHQGIVNVVTHCSELVGFVPQARCAQFMAVSFDACAWETWACLNNGGTLVLRECDPLKTLKAVSALITTPTGLRHMGQPEDFPNLKFVTVTGEACPLELKNLWCSATTFVNGGGPSEVGILAHLGVLTRDDEINLGKIIPNAVAYVLDNKRRQVPLGTVGEIYTGGIGISPGYINLPQLNAERFVEDPFEPSSGTRFFKTGDLGRIREDGTLELLGRLDDERKVKGYRVSLDSISAAMMKHDGVTTSATILKDNNHLVGFVTPADVDLGALRTVMASLLPWYMVPAVFIPMAVLPTNTNGKIDKKALAALDIKVEVDDFRSESERVLATVWSEVLGTPLEQIGRNSNFLALGGDSISAILLMGKSKALGFALTPKIILKTPVLAKMALIRSTANMVAANVVPSGPVTGPVPLTPIQHMFFGKHWRNIHHFNQEFLLKPCRPVDAAGLQHALAQLLEYHDMLRARFVETEGEDGRPFWTQTVLQPSDLPPATVTEVSVTKADIPAQLELTQRSLDISNGPIHALLLIRLPDGSQRVFFTIHHLVVDLVSWRILLDHLETLLKGGKLPAKTASYQTWAEYLKEFSELVDPTPWGPYLGAMLDAPSENEVAASGFNDVVVQHSIDRQTSEAIDLANVPYGSNIQELVLAALAFANAEISGGNVSSLTLDIEGHGRDLPDSNHDVSNTVGWFTSIHPLNIEAGTASPIGDVIKQIKQKLRAVPDKGVSYGVIQYLSSDADPRTAAIKAATGLRVAFNYLGRFKTRDTLFEILNMHEDESMDQGESLLHPAYVSVIHQSDGCLGLVWRGERWVKTDEDVRRWFQLAAEWLRRICDHCTDPENKGGFTLSDFPLLPSSEILLEAEGELVALGLNPLDVDDLYPVTPLQLSFLSSMMKDRSQYCVQNVIDIRGDLPMDILKDAWARVTQTHPILRTCFVSTVEGIMQVVPKKDLAPWTQFDGEWDAEPAALLVKTKEFLKADRALGFTMADNSFQRFKSVRLSDGRIRLFWTNQHALSDGWSLGLTLDAIRRACADLELHPPQSTFKDHVRWLLAADPTASERFWKEALKNVLSTSKLTLPKAPAAAPDAPRYAAFERSLGLPSLQQALRKHGFTMSTAVRTAWALTLKHYTRNDDVVFGSVVSGRDGGLDQIDKIIGVFINTIAVPAHLSADKSLKQALLEMQRFSADVSSFSHDSALDVQRWAGAPSSVELFDTLVVFQNTPPPEKPEKAPFTFELAFTEEYAAASVALSIGLTDDIMHIWVSYERSLDGECVQQMADHFVHVLSQMCVNLDQTVEDLDKLSDRQVALFNEFSFGPKVPLRFSMVHEEFQERAKRHPDWPAIEHMDKGLTYGELSTRATEIARTIQSKGIQHGSRIAVVMQRRLEYPLAVASVMFASCTLVPIDSQMPADRISFILADGDVACILTTESELAMIHGLKMSQVHVIVVNAFAELPASVPMSLPSYKIEDFMIVWTSGSTGKPKAVPVPHLGVVNCINATAATFGAREHTRTCQFAALGFDVAQIEIWSGLSNGCCLVLREEDAYATFAKIDTLSITSTGLTQMGHPSSYPNIKVLGCGAESLPKAIKDLWAPYVRFCFGYGPTEASICSHFGVLGPDDEIHVGRPLQNTSSYILDAALRPVPVGVVGEMYLGGIGLARGYINLPEATAEKFIPDPFVGGDGTARMYATGDFARFTAEGNVQIIGRRDAQVKLRGYRIELDEVAHAMMAHPGVTTAAAVVKDGIHLVGYFTPKDVNVSQLSDVVSNFLPSFMRPAVYIGLDVMPTNQNGKTDKKVLEAMEYKIAVDELETDIERKLAQVWAQVLRVPIEDIGRNTSFFALGGDSLSIIKTVTALKRAGLQISVAEMFAAQVLGAAARIVDANGTKTFAPATVWPSHTVSDELLDDIKMNLDFSVLPENLVTVENVYPASPMQAAMVSSTVQNPTSYLNQLTWVCASVEVYRLRQAVIDLVATHPILRTSFAISPLAGVYQIVCPEPDDLIFETASDTTFESFLQQDRARGFHLGERSWIRVTLVNNQHVCLTIHHALYDGWSLPAIASDFTAAYNSLKMEPRPSFKSFIDYIQAQDGHATETFWKEYLAGVVPATPLALGPADRTATEDIWLEEECCEGIENLKDAAKAAGVTLATLIKVAWALTLRKYQRTGDIVFAEVVANRDIDLADAARIIGPLLNTVPCRIHCRDDISIVDLLQSVQSSYSAVLPHAHAGLVNIQEWSSIPAEAKLMQSLFTYENLPDDGIFDFSATPTTNGLVPLTNSVRESSAAVAYTCELIVFPSSSALKIAVQFDHKILARTQAVQILEELQQTIADVIKSIGERRLLADLWQHRTAHDSLVSGPSIPLPYELVHQGIEPWIREHPEWQAVEFGAKALSYGQLDAAAKVLANRLRVLDIARGSRVAVIMRRCLEFPLSLLAVLRTGATIIPIDCKFSPRRIEHILSNAGASAIVSRKADAPVIDTTQQWVWADVTELLASSSQRAELPALDASATSADEFACIYTSGSTGTPKGVPIPHQGAVNIISLQSASIGCVPRARVMQFMNQGFDVCLWEVFGSLNNGCTLVLREEGEKLFENLKTVDVLHITPTGLAQLEGPEHYSNLKHLIVGGEACPARLKDQWASTEGLTMWNVMGPSEVSIISHAGTLHPDRPVTVGRPVANNSCYVLDKQQRIVPIGVVGELYTSTPGVAASAGYINLPDMTAKRFITNPFAHGRLFQTGDLGRVLSDGSGAFQLIGRKDDQYKVKGYRVEANEIAAALAQHPSVKSSAAIVKDGDIVGYFSPADIDEQEIRACMAAILPSYMIPAALVGLAAMPLNANGKVDKKRLANLEVSFTHHEPEGATEQRLAHIWARVLKISVNAISRNSSFFALGGDSLSVIRMSTACRQAGLEISVPDLFAFPTLRGAAQVLDSKAGVGSSTRVVSRFQLSDQALDALMSSDVRPLFGVGKEELRDTIFPTSPLQAAMVIASIRDRSAYLHQAVFESVETIRMDKLRAAVLAAAETHDILRSSFVVSRSGEIYQHFVPLAASNICNASKTTDLRIFLDEDHKRGFTVADPNWIRMTKVGDRHAVLTLHHALYDGSSIGNLVQDVAAAYAGHTLAARPSFRTFIDFREALQTSETERFWRKYLNNIRAAEPLALGRGTAPGRSDPHAWLSMDCSVPLIELQQASRDCGVTQSTFLKVAWALALRKYLRSSDIVFGEVLANRHDARLPDAERITGPLLNTVACRVHLQDSESIRVILARAQQDHAEVLRHTNVSLGDVQRWMDLKGDEKLFNSLFTYESPANATPEERRSGADLTPLEHRGKASNRSLAYSFEIMLFPNTYALHLAGQFDHAHMDRAQAKTLLEEFDFTVSQMIVAVTEDKYLCSLWESAPARSSVAVGPQIELPYALIHEGFLERYRMHPDWTAVEFGSNRITYRQLYTFASTLAQHMQSTMGLVCGSRVAIMMDRSAEFVVALVAVAMSGAVAVPLDASTPVDRLNFVLSDAEPSAVLTTRHLSALLSSLTSKPIQHAFVDLDELARRPAAASPVSAAKASDTAFLVFTSGSTGTPKAVPVPHQGAVNIIALQSTTIGCVPRARVMQMMNIGFDVAEWEVWGALSNGCILVLREEENVFDNIRTVEVLHITPTGLSLLGGPDDFPNLRHVIVGGEPCPARLRDQWASSVKMHNVMGPTETSIVSHMGVLKPGQLVTVGTPVANNACYVLDADRRIVPIGVLGELYTSSPGVNASPGYLNLPELSAERFAPNPFGPGRLFKTGDLGRMLTTGAFELLARLDDQWKVAGYRIEQQEITDAMMKHAAVSSAAAIVKSGNLVAFFSPSTVDVTELRRIVADVLPNYMIPSVFHGLETLPVNGNGKIDKKALSTIDLDRPNVGVKTELEIALAAVWGQSLKKDLSYIGRETSYFSVGGSSLSAVSLHFHIKQRWNVDLKINSMFKNPTLKMMAQAIEGIESPSDLAPATEGKAPKIKILCFHALFANSVMMENAMANLIEASGQDIEFLFCDAPFKVKPLNKDYENVTVYQWTSIDAATTDADKFTQAWTDWAVPAAEYEGLIAFLSQKLHEVGPVDGLLGFSQGCWPIELLDRLAHLNVIERTWKFTVHIGGVSYPSAGLPSKIRDALAIAGPIASPTIIAYGKQEIPLIKSNLPDQYTVAARTILEHEGGHVLPSGRAFCEALVRAIKATTGTTNEKRPDSHTDIIPAPPLPLTIEVKTSTKGTTSRDEKQPQDGTKGRRWWKKYLQWITPKLSKAKSQQVRVTNVVAASRQKMH
ncbi:hypothetical protein HDU90_006429 [Geranomyces variabilis]|nr:hypothetical protein HDU90_006429 [Geranomyces variabilis]